VPQMPSGDVTFLFTDIEGSTRRWERQREAMHVAVDRHLDLLRAAVEAHDGVLFKTIGDAIQAAFPTAPAALAAAIDAQRVIAAEPWGDLAPLRVRMALHTGLATPREGDYLAPCLNRLARLLATGYGGQVLLTQATRQLVRDHCPPDVSLRDLGVHRLRDLLEPEQVFQAAGPGLADDFPPLKSLDRQPHNLPPQPTPLIGREAELEELRRMLREGVRLVTLVGPGGAGKTRLALQIAAEMVDGYADGAWFVPLAPIADPALVASTIAHALGVREIVGQSMRESLTDFLRSKSTLLVLDNVEQVIDAAPLVADLLAACLELRIIATSRMPLRLAGEQELAVPPLPLPPSDDAPPETLLQSDAVRLFVERAQAVQTRFALDAGNARAVAEICRRLDGLPLAVELAAARVKLLPPEAILRRLDHRLALLTGGGRDRPERQQTLRDTIAWSHDLLSPEEQTLFARLAVFAGGFSLEAADAVAAGEPALEVFDGVDSLFDKSLLRRDDAVDDAEPRFTMLQTIHEFAREQLQASPAAHAVQSAHADFFLTLATDAEAELNGPNAAARLDELEREHDNLRAAIQWRCRRSDAAGTLRLAAALWRFWWAHGHVTEGRAHLAAALGLAAPPDVAAIRAAALDGAGVLAEVQGDLAAAEALHDEALALARQTGDAIGVARALGNLGVVADDRGDGDRAAELLEESLILARQTADVATIATVLTDLGWAVYGRGDLARSEALHAESLALRRQIGNPTAIARSLYNLGAIAFLQDDAERARPLFEESLALYEQAGDRWGQAGALNSLGEIARADGDLAGAASRYEQSLALFAAIGDARSQALVWFNLGLTARALDDAARAGAAFREALARQHAFGDRAGCAAALAGLGGLARERTDWARATALLAAAASLVGSDDLPAVGVEAPDYAADRAAARSALGDAAFALAWDAGRSLDPDITIRSALAEPTAAAS
jgi:predicted ATPase/class 3 adenylate cyclase